MARDRHIDVSSTNNTGSRTTTTTRNGRFFQQESAGGQSVDSHVRKRVPTGGKAKPEREKPFIHSRVVVQFPQGSLQCRQDAIYAHLYEGSLGSGGYGNDGGTTQMRMGFPYASPRHLYNVQPGVNPDLLSQAEVKSLNKLRDKTDAADLDVGLWYAERRETAGLFRDAVVGLAQLAQSIARKNLGESARVLRDVFGVSSSKSQEAARMRRVERWLRKELRRAPSIAERTLRGLEDAVLRYNLGISPALEDLKGAHQTLLRGTLPERMRIKSVSRHGTQEQGMDIHKSGSAMPWSVETFLNHTHGYTVTLIAEPLITDIARLQRLGLTNPVGTLYQAASLTFMLDYFYALGQYLEALNVPLGFRFIDGSWTHRIVTNVIATFRSFGGKVAKGRWTRNYLKRTVYTNFPVPIPPLSLRGKDLSAKQSVNTGLITLKSLRTMLGLK